MKREYVAYHGKIFTIEWYFDDRDKSPALDYFAALVENQKIKLIYLFHMIADTGKIRNEQKFRYEGDYVYAFKLSPHRFLCFFCTESKIIVTNAYTKKTDKMPKKEKIKALCAKEDYIKRNKMKKYYE
jgi:phage-related protein